MGEWKPIVPPEPDLRVQFSDWIDHGYVPTKRFEQPPEPCILCGKANCTGESHGTEPQQVEEHEPVWWEGHRDDEAE